MDRIPLPPPFPSGARVRLLGKPEFWREVNGKLEPLVATGEVVKITATRPGRQGTLAPLPGEWEDDDPPLDTTRDGYSVFQVQGIGGRIIWPTKATDWERVDV